MSLHETLPPGQLCNSPRRKRCFRAAILLTEGFSLLSLTSLTDVLGAVQAMSPGDFVSVSLLSVDGTAIRSSSKVQVVPDGALADSLPSRASIPGPDIYIICSGVQIPACGAAAAERLVRHCKNMAAPVCLIGAVIRVITMSGHMSKGTDHWSRLSASRERLPHVEFKDTIFVRDGNVISCPGEMGAMDFALNWVADNVSSGAAAKIRNYLLLQSVRSADRTQTCTVADRYRGVPDKLQNAIGVMLGNLETPLHISEIAQRTGLSVRQLERLFSRHLGTSPMAFYRKQRLDLGRSLVEDTAMQVTEVALACGFQSLSAFSKLFRKEFGATPMALRAARKPQS